MADSTIDVAGTGKALRTFDTGVGHDEYVRIANPDAIAVSLPQSVDAGNTAFRTDAEGDTQFVGTWSLTRSAGIVRQLVVLASNVASGLGGTFVFEYGEDGVTAVISESRVIGDFATVRDFDLINAGAYFRVKFTPSRALTGSEFVAITTTQRRQNDGAFVRLANQEIEEANAAMGQQFAYIKAFSPDTGKSVNIRPTTQGDLRVGFNAFEIPELTGDLIAGVGASAYTGFADVKNFAALLITVSVDQLILGYTEWSTDGATVISNYTTPFIGAGSFSVPIAARYMRIRMDNLGAATATLSLSIHGQYQAPGLFLFPAAAPIDGSFPAALVKSIGTANQPDGDYVNDKADGTAFITYDALAASGTFDSRTGSGILDTDGWETVELVIKTDQVSAGLGVQIHYVDDVQAVTPIEIYRESFTFTASDVAAGFTSIRRSTHGDGLYVTYQNGGFDQSVFVLQCNLMTQASLPLNSLESSISGTSQSVMGRNAIFADNGADYALIGRGSNGGLDVGIVQHEVRTPLRPCDAWKVSAGTATTTAAVLLDASAALASRVTVEVYNADSTKDLHIGISAAAVTAGNFRTVAPGQGIVLELGPGASIAGKSSTGSIQAQFIEIADTTSSG